MEFANKQLKEHAPKAGGDDVRRVLLFGLEGKNEEAPNQKPDSASCKFVKEKGNNDNVSVQR